MSDITSEVARRRTFAIISHPDAGKTTLTEKLLLFAGAIHIAGSIKARKASRHATSDWMEIEKQRGISVASSVMQMEYRGCVVNLLDTPGHEDFSEDTYRVLTAVDAALMVIDAAKGIEPRTLKLLEVCRSRNTPVATFVNKLDRDVRPPLELLDEIESVLHMAAAPFTWPIGAGREFRGVFDFRHDCIRLFQAGSDRLTRDVRKIGMRDPACPELLGEPYAPALAEAELVRDAGSAFDRAAFLAGRQTPVFFGSAVNNFGVQEVLDALVDFAPPPGPRVAAQRSVAPDEPACSGVVFKIQANMDPAHRDRVAFVRLSSGRFVRGMRLVNCRTGRELRTSNAVSFLSQRRDIVDEAYAGDIIGIPNHGTIALGDTLTEGEVLQFGGLPFFAPELFRRAELATPMKAKQLHTGLRQLSEEGAIQIYYPEAGGAPILGAVGALQFDVVAHRLVHEYGVDVRLLPEPLALARWLSAADDAEMQRFMAAYPGRIARDASGALAYLAANRAELEVAEERWPQIAFHTLREITSGAERELADSSLR
ncbi:MAG: peptide chain release factor 3 [Proteobacteria bacterium]|nr:peptide chain release factor 3 [Pseudomonadota bacterium]